MNNDERIWKAKQLRYKKSMLEGLNYEYIYEKIIEIDFECSDIQYLINDDNALLDAMDGDDEQVYEFRMMFADLSAEVQNLQDIIGEYTPGFGLEEMFDNFFVGIMCGGRSPFQILGFDGYQEDYFRLIAWDADMAENEAFKRLMRLKKEDIIKQAGRCFGLAVSFFNVVTKFDYLKASFDILRNENTTYLKIIKEIDEAYAAAEARDFSPYSDVGQRFNKLVGSLPDKVWIE